MHKIKYSPAYEIEEFGPHVVFSGLQDQKKQIFSSDNSTFNDDTSKMSRDKNNFVKIVK